MSVILPGCSSAVTPAATIAPGLPASAALSHSSRSVSAATLFVADPVANAIVEYPAGVDRPKSIGKITDGISGPIDVAVDGFGTVYALNAGGTQRGSGLVVTEYAAGTTTPAKTVQLPKNDFSESRIAAGPDGMLYVLASDNNGPIVLEYPRGAGRASYIVRAIHHEGFGPLAIDAGNDLYIVVSAVGTAVDRYVPRSQAPAFVKGSAAAGGPIAFDGTGNTLVSGGAGEGSWVRVIDPSGNRTQFESGSRNFMTFDGVHSLLYTSFGTVSIIDYKTRTVVGSIPAERYATGVAISPATY